MNKNVSILVGADNRYPIVNYTLKRISSYFDKILIVFNCPLEYEHLYDFKKYKNVHVVYIKRFYGDLEPCRRATYKNLPKNEWFLWLDSDETPSQLLLSNLDKVIEDLTINNRGVGRFPYVEHSYNTKNDIDCYRNNPFDMSVIPKDQKDFELKNWFCGPRFLKNENLFITSNFGGHETFCYTDSKKNTALYFPYHIIHHKSDLSIYQSQLYHLFTIPWQHENFKNWVTIKDSEEFKMLRHFQKKWNVFNSNELSIQFEKENENFILELESMLKSFNSSNIFCFKWLSEILKTGSIKLNTLFFECKDKTCCDYKL